jgi:hypothetical protein
MKLLCREVPTPPISPDAFLAFHNFSPWHEKKPTNLRMRDIHDSVSEQRKVYCS